ncbi:50S ribosomal protein L27 [Candidatus Roizmanbacteria bacterium RIFCSPHIGHO2_12_FULL_44_10]|uniref:Large ribosomal subunit protein bL27 n=1 Tax=Candidatus Roizmanbacteria bacterium RIFCSPHIGHO2_12_FULL_44_10 TaxID=1802054 RepID=A0A1F7I5P5_9BACT|nr:MAG: 50S ribosomal protein L27 [Candidatus Roizmanbacteria bacterium RIFCSPHIGHO2_12_FULL_44_10]
MAHTKSQKAAKGNKDSQSKRLGIKLYGGETARAGNVIVRQRGMTFKSGVGTYLSKDYTLHAEVDGEVQYITKRGRKYVTVSTPK